MTMVIKNRIETAKAAILSRLRLTQILVFPYSGESMTEVKSKIMALIASHTLRSCNSIGINPKLGSPSD
jgi:hypothetical protein